MTIDNLRIKKLCKAHDITICVDYVNDKLIVEVITPSAEYKGVFGSYFNADFEEITAKTMCEDISFYLTDQENTYVLLFSVSCTDKGLKLFFIQNYCGLGFELLVTKYDLQEKPLTKLFKKSKVKKSQRRNCMKKIKK